MEVWKEIEGYEGKYYVSNKGNVKSSKGKVDRILKPYNISKYKAVGLANNGKTKITLIHRLVAEAFIPNPDNKPQVNHIDGVQHNNVITNLEWVTAKENIEHAYKTGLMPKFRSTKRKIHTRVLQDEDVYFILQYKDRFTHQKLAQLFNVTENAVWKIINNKSWKFIDRDAI